MSDTTEQSALAALFLPIIKVAVREALAERVQDEGPEPLWDRSAAAKYLKCSTVKLDQMVTAKILPSKLVGGSRRFDPALLRAWVRAGDSAGGAQ
jgi:hypothetical protein